MTTTDAREVHAQTEARVVRVQNENARLRSDNARLRADSTRERQRRDELLAEAADLRRQAVELSSALTSRIVIEQAKGIVAERGHVDLNVAFLMLRRKARDANRRLHDVCAAVVASAEHTHVPPWGDAA